MRTAIVTGADSGIGAAIARVFASSGANVTVNYIEDEDGARGVVRDIESAGGNALLVKADVRSETDVERLFSQTEHRFGTVDVLVNNAAVNSAGKDVADLELSEWQKLIDTNLTAGFLCSRRFVRPLRERKQPGRIINITSVHQEMPAKGVAEYAAAKAGLWNFSKVLALEVAELGITVNNIAPGTILTPMNQELLDDPKALAEHVKTIPMRRAGRPEDIAGVALFLAGNASSYMTGATLVVDGGMLLNVGSGVPQRG